jgi:hypothetical protein
MVTGEVRMIFLNMVQIRIWLRSFNDTLLAASCLKP